MQRCGQLLKEFDGKGNNQHTVGDHSTQRQAASDAGMSEHQQFQVIRVANVPEDEFEEAVEAVYAKVLEFFKPLNSAVRSRVVKILTASFG